MRRIKHTLTALALTSLAGCAIAQDSTSLTIYSTATPGAIDPNLYRPVPGGTQYNNPYQRVNQIQGYAIIRQDRTLDLEKGISNLEFTDVAALIDPTTVRFESLTHPDSTSVLDQNYQYDLVSIDRLLERYIDHPINVDGQEHTLLSAQGGILLLQNRDGSVRSQVGYQNVTFPALDQALVTKPTLSWTVSADHAGDHDTRISYETQGITWWADYNLVFNPGDTENTGTIDLGAWVSILNQSGGSYTDAQLKLVAGDVNRAQPNNKSFYGGYEAMSARAVSADMGFEEKSFFEYHLYALGRKVSIPDRSTKQIELFESVNDVPATKILVYDGAQQFAHYRYANANTDQSFGSNSNAKVEVHLRFKNDKDHGLGMPLPSGRMRVSQLDEADNAYEFIGESVIDHTPRNEHVTIKLGNAFDVVGERKQTDFKRGSRWVTESFEINVRNQKEEPVDVLVQEHLYRWSNADITATDHEYDQIDARTIHFPITIGPEQEETITYTVHYTW